MKKLSIFLLLLLAVPSFAANTTVETGNMATITGLDADWSWATDLSSRLKNKALRSIEFVPSATDDVFVLRSGVVATGAKVFYVKCATVYDQRSKTFGPKSSISPVIDISDCTLGTASNAMVILEFE